VRRTKSAIANAISTIGSLEMAALLTFSLASIAVSMWEEAPRLVTSTMTGVSTSWFPTCSR
jgi:hypothetical protein